MKKILMRVTVVAAMVFTGFSMTGCTDFERGVAVGTAAGVAGTVIATDGSTNRPSRPSRNRMYNRGVKNGCSSARGRWYKSSYNWRNYSNYRSGWRDGYRRCR